MARKAFLSGQPLNRDWFWQDFSHISAETGSSQTRVFPESNTKKMRGTAHSIIYLAFCLLLIRFPYTFHGLLTESVQV